MQYLYYDTYYDIASRIDHDGAASCRPISYNQQKQLGTYITYLLYALAN